MKRVAIIGSHAVRGRAFANARLEEIVFEAVAAALEDAGVAREELGGVTLGASDELDGRSITSMLLAMPAGAFLKDEIRTTSGMHALALQAMRVQSGLFDLGIAVSWSKSSETSADSVQWTSLDPFIGRDMGLIDPIASAVMANAYLDRFDRDRDDFDRRAARKTEQSGRGSESKPEATGGAHPFRSEHLAPIVDGAAAVVLASPRAVESRRPQRPPIWLRGLGWATGSHALSERALTEWPVLGQATREALGRAGVQAGEIEHFELDDYSVLHEAMAVEGIGLAGPGAGFDYLFRAKDDGCSVNPSGGGFGGYPLVCAGLWRMVEARREMTESGIRRALVHGTTGIAAQGHEVAVLEGTERR